MQQLSAALYRAGQCNGQEGKDAVPLVSGRAVSDVLPNVALPAQATQAPGRINIEDTRITEAVG